MGLGDRVHLFLPFYGALLRSVQNYRFRCHLLPLLTYCPTLGSLCNAFGHVMVTEKTVHYFG